MSTVPTNIAGRIRGLLADQADEAVRKVAEHVLERARADAPPSPPSDRDPDPTVSLKDSGRVEKIEDGVYRVIFDTPYAAKIHENMRLEHPHGGKAKFLEHNVQLAARDLPEALRAATFSATTADRHYRRPVS